jgi:hypothetical protein
LSRASTELPDDSGTLPEISITGRPLRSVTADAIDALLKANARPELFVRSGALCRVRRDETDRPLLERVTESSLRYRLARVSDFVKVTQRKETVPIAPPSETVQDVLAQGAWPFPPLEAVVEVPVLRPDGTVLSTAGYDPITKLFYAAARRLVVPLVPDTPTATEVRAALGCLTDILQDFPFTDRAGAANTLGLLLTPVLRPAISGQVPLALIDKPKRGTGATLLAQVVTGIALGSATDLTTAPRDDEEWRKKITAALLAGATVMFFDNVEHTLSSPSLAAALTTRMWSDRILGRSEMARDIPQRVTWMATGNNLHVGGDLARRSYWIRLDAAVARPWQRETFRYPQLLAHVLENRGPLLAAALTLGRAWFAAGCPKATVPKLGGFEGWADTIGGVLAYAGVSGFLDNLDYLYEQVDEEETVWEHFLSSWYNEYGNQPQTVAELTADLQKGESALRDALPGELAEALSRDGKGMSFTKRLGNALAKRVDAIFGSLRLERAGTAHQACRWRLRRVPEGSLGGSGSFLPPIAPDDEEDGERGGTDEPQANGPEKTPQTPETPAERDPGVATALSVFPGATIVKHFAGLIHEEQGIHRHRSLSRR